MSFIDGRMVHDTDGQNISNKIGVLSQNLAETAQYVIARNFSGINGGEKIQNALDSVFPFASSNKIVVVEGKGMDTNGEWLLKTPLKIPSNTTLLLNGCYLKLDANINKFIIQNSDYINGNENIHILGNGSVVLDCNRDNQVVASASGHETLGIHFYNVNNFSIKGITVKDSMKQVIVPEKCTNGVIDDIYLDTKGYVNQDGIHILGPSSNIIVSKIRGVVGDDALVVNSQYNPAQGYALGGEVTNIIFDDIIIEGGTIEGSSHAGLLRTAPGNEWKIENIVLSNAIGRNLKDAILRLGGNTVAPIANHKNVKVKNVSGYSGTSGSIAIAYLRTPVMNLQIDGITIQTTNDYLFANRGHSVTGLQLTNVIRNLETVNGEALRNESIELINGTIKDIQISNIQDNHASVSTTYFINISNATVENIQVNNVKSLNTKSYILTTSSTPSRVRLREMLMNTNDSVAYAGITGDKDIVVNGYATETSNTASVTPTRTNYQVGDNVLYRENSSTAYRLYQKDHGNGWRQIG